MVIDPGLRAGVAEPFIVPDADQNLSQPFSAAIQRTIESFDRVLNAP